MSDHPRFALKVDEQYLKAVGVMSGHEMALDKLGLGDGEENVVYVVIEVLSPVKFIAELMLEEQVFEEYRKDDRLKVLGMGEE